MNKNYSFNNLVELSLNDAVAVSERKEVTLKKTILLTLFAITLIFVFSSKMQAQTLISPTGDGGFETNTTFPTNGWTAVSAASNYWILGTAAGQYAGNRGAFISNNGTAYSYNVNNSRTSHFYRDVAVPAGSINITLSFYWKGSGEANYDRALVYTAPTSVTPVANTPASNTTTLAGATLVWTQPSLTSTYTLATITLPNALAGTTVRLIFTWQNDGSLGTAPGAAIDNISLTYTTSAPCVTPSAQPTALTFGTVATTSIAGSFTVASPAADKYLVLRSTSATAPSPGPTGGTTYVAGNTFSGATVVSAGSGNTFTATGLTPGTQYYFYIYSYNDACTGGPLYRTLTPLTGNRTTLTPPVNYLCSTATALPCATTNMAGTTVNSANTAHGTACTIGNYGVWYTFVGDGNVATISSTGTSGWDHEMSISSGSCGGFTNITCQDASGSNGTETYTFGTTVGVNYYVYIADYASGGTTTGTFTISRTCAPPPINLTCATATTLACATSNLATTTIGAANNAHGTACTMGNYGVWYTFVGDGNINTISTTATSGWDHEMSISSGACGGLTSVTCQDLATSNGTETYTFTATLGVNYFIYVAGYANASTVTGNFTISRTCIVPPTNTTCATATALPCATSNLAGTTTGAPNNAHGTACTMGNYGVWYTFVGDGNQSTINTTASGWDHEMSISSGSCGSYTSIACQDLSATGGTETYTFTTVAGVNYYVYIAGYASGSTATGNFTISRICAPPPTTPVNHLCSTATTLPCGTANMAGTTVNSLNTPHGTACTMGNYGVWYTFVGDGNLNTISSTATSGWDHEMSISSGSCGSFTSIACQDIGLTNGTETYSFTTVAGVNYYVYIAGYAAASTVTGAFIISRNCATPPAPMTNDECANAIPLTVNTTCSYSTFTNATATASAGAPAPGCASYSGGDVWFTAVVPTNGILYFDSMAGSLTDGGMAIYSGTCGGLTLIECDDYDSSNPGDMPFISRTDLIPGQTIFIRFWEYGNNNNGTFELCVTSPQACTLGTGTGTSDLGCPTVVSGININGDDPAPINSCVASSCTTLMATYKDLKQPTTYRVDPITYAPPYQFGCLRKPVSVNVDDVWSPAINLPFDFCFYGNTYNQCLIGSNGVLTFDTTTNTPEGYSTWSFSNNLPNASLFRNTIFGVYQDIDPSKGGTIAWELITINSGCRALVASWKDIPMFSSTCNSQLYTGMIVLYENTNVIEVYVQQKSTCASWNAGNAIIGIQNAAGTTGIAAPGRNTTDDWNTTNEAWRFTPDGASVTSIKWFEGAGTTGPQVGTSPTLSVCPAATTTYTAEVSYTLCNGTIHRETDQTTIAISGSKTWNGSVSTDWATAANWTPAVLPTLSECVLVPVVGTNRYPIISTTGNGLAGTLTINTGASLTVNSGRAITVTDWVSTAGTFTIENAGSLVQINNTTNIGNIIYKRNAPNVKALDYVYWSSPVANFNVNSITAPLAPGPIYAWHPTVANPNGGQGNWQAATGNTMLPAKGYIVRAPGTFTSTPATLSGSFTGIPNNGTITTPISRGSDQNTAYHQGTNGTQITNFSDNNNLIGNPYPSAIRGSEFLFNNNTKIEGNLKLWTHGALPAIISSPFYNTFIYNYNANDYLTFNFTGTSCCPAAEDDIFIGAGQGFVVQMKDGPAASDVVTFTNSMRSVAHDNSVFYRMTNQGGSNQIVNLERNRIWLDIINADSQSDRTLIGYIEGATAERDSFYDAGGLLGGSMSIYSMIGSEKFNIQGRALPFDENDTVPLAVTIPTAGNYKIGINAVDGLFTNPTQSIFLEDRTLNLIHDLRFEPYAFDIQSGVHQDRFVLRYTDSALGVHNPITNQDAAALIDHKELFVQATQNIEQIEVYDISGKWVKTFNPKGKSKTIIDDFPFANGVYFAKIKLESGLLLIKKLMN